MHTVTCIGLSTVFSYIFQVSETYLDFKCDPLDEEDDDQDCKFFSDTKSYT